MMHYMKNGKSSVAKRHYTSAANVQWSEFYFWNRYGEDNKYKSVMCFLEVKST